MANRAGASLQASRSERTERGMERRDGFRRRGRAGKGWQRGKGWRPHGVWEEESWDSAPNSEGVSATMTVSGIFGAYAGDEPYDDHRELDRIRSQYDHAPHECLPSQRRRRFGSLT